MRVNLTSFGGFITEPAIDIGLDFPDGSEAAKEAHLIAKEAAKKLTALYTEKVV